MLPVSDAVRFVDSSIAGGDGGGNSFESKLVTESFACAPKRNEYVYVIIQKQNERQTKSSENTIRYH